MTREGGTVKGQVVCAFLSNPSFVVVGERGTGRLPCLTSPRSSERERQDTRQNEQRTAAKPDGAGHGARFLAATFQSFTFSQSEALLAEGYP